MSKKILIIGGLGYIGSVLYDVIKAEGWDVDILDSHLYSQVKPANPFIQADVRIKEQIEAIIPKYDVIVNTAAIVGDPACLADTNLAIDTNCTGTRNVADICSKLNKHIVHFSTCSIYGSEPNKIVKEEDEGFPIDFYGQTKYTQERLVREICKTNHTIFRLGTAYGLSPRMRYDLVVNVFSAQAKRDKKITVFGGEQERPFIHIRDISRAVVHAIKKDLRGIFNLRGDNLSLIKVSEIVKELTGCTVEIKKEIVDKRNYIVDNSKIENTGFKTNYTIKDAVKEIFESPTAMEYDNLIYNNSKLVVNLKQVKKFEDKGVQVINGGIAVDDRGYLIFANDFNFFGVKRFYQVTNFSTSTIRAFHGHLHEGKYVYVAKGSAIVCAVKLDNVQNPSKSEKVQRFICSDKQPKIIFIPPGYANGFRPLEEGTQVLFFSTSSLDESKGDDYRFAVDYWGMSCWEVENR